MSEKTTRLWTFISGVRPSAEPSAMPAATCPGVPSECSVLMIDWISLSRVNMPRVSSTLMPRSRRAPQVHKFGGASLADSAAVRHAVDIIRRHRPEPTVVVVSAMAGTTDALLGVAQQAGAGESRTVASLIARLRSRHAEVARALLPRGRGRADVLPYIGDVFEELEALAQGLRLLRELTPRTTDYLVSRGERLSARLVAAALEAAGTKAKYVDALDLVHTDGAFGQAAPDFARTDRSVQRTLAPLLARGIIPVVPGFIGATPDGEVATLGRGGSDLTATLLARGARRRAGLALEGRPRAPHRRSARRARRPRHPAAPRPRGGGARLLRRQGASPARADPGRRAAHPGLRPSVRRSRRARGTEVSERVAPARFPVKALTAAGGQALVTVTGNGMLGVPGHRGAHLRTRCTSGRSRSRSSRRRRRSTRSASACPRRSRTTRARASTREFARGDRAGRDRRGRGRVAGMATVAVVGLGMHGTPGVAAASSRRSRPAKINVVAIAQGSSELNISVVVEARQAAEAQRRIHAAFQLSRSPAAP